MDFITKQKYFDLVAIGCTKGVFSFDTDFAYGGYSSSIQNSKNLFKIFLEIFEEYNNPLLIVPRKVCGYLIVNELMSGLFGKLNSIMKVGELLQNDKQYRVYSSDNSYCKSCGSPRLIDNKSCLYCGSFLNVNYGSVEIYSIPKEYGNTDQIIITDYTLKDATTLKIYM